MVDYTEHIKKLYQMIQEAENNDQYEEAREIRTYIDQLEEAEKRGYD